MPDAGPEEQQSLPKQTAPEKIPVGLSGFDDAASAERFGNVIGAVVRIISCWINLERLDGITVAFNYDQALSQLDRGYQATRPLTRTSGDQLFGVAMAPAVLRNGIVKAHLVFYAPLVLPLEDKEETEGRNQAWYFVAHECGHVQDLKNRDEAFPGTLLQAPITDAEDALLEQTANPLWEEYAACRASAKFGAGQTATLERSFTLVLAVARERANAAIREYRVHLDVDRVLEEAGRPLCEPLRMAAYLIGHLDGLGADLDIAPQARDLLNASPYAPLLQRLWKVLRDLWADRGQWLSRQAFDPLKDIIRDVLTDGGLILSRLPDGRLYVTIPHTPETM